jgi:hypothetical protein
MPLKMCPIFIIYVLIFITVEYDSIEKGHNSKNCVTLKKLFQLFHNIIAIIKPYLSSTL